MLLLLRNIDFLVNIPTLGQEIYLLTIPVAVLQTVAVQFIPSILNKIPK